MHSQRETLRDANEDGEPKFGGVLNKHLVRINVFRADQHVDFITFEVISAQSALPDDQSTWFQGN